MSLLYKYKNVNIKIRSGSSFIGDLLSAHPNAAYYFEPFYLLRPGGHSIERALQEVHFSYLIFYYCYAFFCCCCCHCCYTFSYCSYIFSFKGHVCIEIKHFLLSESQIWFPSKFSLNEIRENDLTKFILGEIFDLIFKKNFIFAKFSFNFRSIKIKFFHFPSIRL